MNVGDTPQSREGSQETPHRSVVTRLATELVARYRAVDREIVGSRLVDTPCHLDALTEDIRLRGVLVPLQLRFNADFAALDGNHRIAVAIRLGIDEVPVELVEAPTDPRPGHAQPMHSEDLVVIQRSYSN